MADGPHMWAGCPDGAPAAGCAARSLCWPLSSIVREASTDCTLLAVSHGLVFGRSWSAEVLCQLWPNWVTASVTFPLTARFGTVHGLIAFGIAGTTSFFGGLSLKDPDVFAWSPLELIFSHFACPKLSRLLTMLLLGATPTFSATLRSGGCRSSCWTMFSAISRLAQPKPPSLTSGFMKQANCLVDGSTVCSFFLLVVDSASFISAAPCEGGADTAVSDDRFAHLARLAACREAPVESLSSAMLRLSDVRCEADCLAAVSSLLACSSSAAAPNKDAVLIARAHSRLLASESAWSPTYFPSKLMTTPEPTWSILDNSSNQKVPAAGTAADLASSTEE
mmetsp:Transcript_68938/g.128728  ORF Transcript_68938/g.128728 Transcript_68938/m.128728 type:complete len:336 (-) Transcript_68938:140-1147(-)